MWAVGLYELLTPGDLTAGTEDRGDRERSTRRARSGRSAGSRTRWSRPSVRGPTLFLAPADNMAELEGSTRGTCEVVAVSTFEDALEALGRRRPPRERSPEVGLGRSRSAAPRRGNDLMSTVRLGGRTRRWPLVLVGAAVALFILFSALSGFVIDLLWYRGDRSARASSGPPFEPRSLSVLVFGLVFGAAPVREPGDRAPAPADDPGADPGSGGARPDPRPVRIRSCGG